MPTAEGAIQLAMEELPITLHGARVLVIGYGRLVNTVPVRVLREAELADLKPGCLVIDLASKPGGVDFDAAARLGVKAFWALSLPGKVAPVTAGKSIKTTIYNILTELGV